MALRRSSFTSRSARTPRRPCPSVRTRPSRPASWRPGSTGAA